MPFYKWTDLENDPKSYKPPVGGGGTITGDFIEVGNYRYPKGHCPGRHSHEHEQVVTVLAGKLRVKIDQDEAIIGPGEACRVPSNVPHEVEVLEDASFVSSKNLVGGKGSAAPRVWYETPHGGKGLTELELEELRKSQGERSNP